MNATFALPNTYIYPQTEEYKPLPLIDAFGEKTYLFFISLFSSFTTKENETTYLQMKEDLSYKNHMELFGEDAVRFDETVNSIETPNALMLEILADVYADRIFN